MPLPPFQPAIKQRIYGCPGPFYGKNFTYCATKKLDRWLRQPPNYKSFSPTSRTFAKYPCIKSNHSIVAPKRYMFGPLTGAQLAAYETNLKFIFPFKCYLKIV
jgi:hypothetical protein